MTSSANSDKVQAAVKVLLRAPTLSVPEGMRLAKFSRKLLTLLFVAVYGEPSQVEQRRY